MKHLNLQAISFDSSGRVELSCETLRSIESAFEVSAGGATTNQDDCGGTTNNACTNEIRCNDSTNSNGCTNTFLRCKGSKNDETEER